MSINYDSILYGVLNIFIDTPVSGKKPVAFSQNMMSYSDNKQDLTTTEPSIANAPNPTGGPLLPPPAPPKQGGAEPATPERGVIIIVNTYFPERMFQKLMKKSPKERISILFDRGLFQKVLFSSLTDASEILEETDENKPKITEMVEYNITQTLALLFPTTLPAKFNISTSYGEYISPGSQKLSFPKYPSLFSYFSSAYSYITLNGKKYTITKVLWLNDFYNHPVYKEFIRQYTDFNNKIKREKTKIGNEYKREYDKLVRRLNLKDTDDRSSLCIFNTEYTKIINDKVNDMDGRPSQSNSFKAALTAMKGKIEEFTGIVSNTKTYDGNDETSINFNKLNVMIDGILELYAKLQGDRYESIALPRTFSDRLKAAKSEIEKLYPLEVIKTYYITEKEFNLNIANEDPNVLKKLETNYKWYYNFITKLKDITLPTRISLNQSFQGLVDSFAKVPQSTDDEAQKKNKETVFKQLLEYVKYKMVYRKPFDTYSDLSKEMKVGVNQVDFQNRNQDTFEIYISLDLLEDVINDSNVNKITCDWRGLYLGNKVGNFMQRKNKYDARDNMLLITKEELYAPKKKAVAAAPPQNVPTADAANTTVPLKRGGRKTRKRRENVNKIKKNIAKAHSTKKRV
jgi:hypothetical protein